MTASQCFSLFTKKDMRSAALHNQKTDAKLATEQIGNRLHVVRFEVRTQRHRINVEILLLLLAPRKEEAEVCAALRTDLQEG